MEQKRISPSHNTDLAICTGSSRKSVQWKNKTTTWAKLLNRCTRTERTDETLAQYLQMSKDEQTRIKDKGGFVGGHLTKNGNRKKDNILNRQVVTLDADSVKPGANVWESFKTKFPDVAACIYSTHKHSPEAPRLRLIIPLSEAVNIEQWEAVSRYVAGQLDIEQFDPTTFQPSRLMYWPSSPADGEFFFDWQDGEIIEAEAILNRYDDWRDVSQWPMHPKETPEAILNNTRKAPDPTAKNGIVGAFCNVYSVKDAIEKFLSDVYEPTNLADRYTYRNGSTFGGLVVYPDGYAFSNHATDPAHFNGHGCNAFDLVRIHKFGYMDTDAKPETPVNRLPSFQQMDDFARRDSEVKRYILQNTKDDFDGVNLDELDDAGNGEPNADDWKGKLTLNKKLEVEATPPNIILLLLNDPELSKIKFDMFRSRDVSFTDKFRNANGAIIDEESAGKISLYFFETYRIKLSTGKIFEYLQTTATERGFNPVKEFITRETWDGHRRAETALIDYLGAEDTALNRAVTKKWFVAAVARIYEPGIKFDYVLTIPGVEGIGKSTFFRTIAGEWFSDSFSFAAKDNAKYEAVNSAWILELSELANLRRTEAEAAKQFISKQSDNYRAAYARATKEYPRHSVFAATTNEDYFLTGDNGNRRWWIVRAEGKGHVSQWLETLKANVAQIWAEAYYYYQQGEELCLPDELEAEARKVQFNYNQAGGDDLFPVIESFLNVKLPTDWEIKNKEERKSYFKYMDVLSAVGEMQREFVSAEVIANELPDDRIKKYSSQRINAILERCKDWRLTDKKLASPGSCYARSRKVFEHIAEPPEDEI